MREITHLPDGSSRLSRIEFLYPNIDHGNSNLCIRQQGLSSSAISSLFCLKNDLLPSQERLFNCKKAESPRCVRCSRIDNHGHFLMCEGLASVVDPIVSALRLLDTSVSLERIVHSDYNGDSDEKFVKCWWVSKCVTYVWECKKSQLCPNFDSLLGILKADILIYEKLSLCNQNFTLMYTLVKNLYKNV